MGVILTLFVGLLVPSTAMAQVLYSQLSGGDTDGITIWNAADDTLDAEAADDVVVPAGSTWLVDEVTIGVATFAGPATSVDVIIYDDAAGEPGVVVCDYLALVPVETAGQLDVVLPSSCELTPGTYWVAAIVNSATQYYYASRAPEVGLDAKWRNPGDGYGSGCTDWSTISACVDGFASDALRFELRGRIPCGDGVVEYALGEECDDTNAVAGDGCAADCTVEAALVNRMDSDPLNVGWSSQNFEAANDGFDTMAADDFVISPTDAFWEIGRVFVAGQQGLFGAQVAAANVRFFAKSGTLPGAAVDADAAGNSCQFLGVVPVQNDGWLMIDLPAPCRLAAGEYFVSVQADRNFDPDGQWYWYGRLDIDGDEGAWQNPLGGFGVCPAWDTLDTCIAPAPSDLMYAFDGVVPSCGDGEEQGYTGEECDDGNDASGDGCSANCETEGAGGSGQGGSGQGGSGQGGSGQGGSGQGGGGPTGSGQGGSGVGAGPSSGAGANGDDEDSEAEEGCGCRVPGRASGDARWLSVLLLASVVVARRRRRR
jgi:cysteine-rich repeat protein